MVSEQVAKMSEELTTFSEDISKTIARFAEESAIVSGKLAMASEKLAMVSEKRAIVFEQLAMDCDGLESLPLLMGKSTIYTLVTTADIAKGLASGHGFGGSPLSDYELLTGFVRHAVGGRTPFVPVSKQMIDTLQKALEQYRRNKSPADVWIIFVEVPANDTRENPIRIHSADELAEKCEHPNPKQFQHEALVEYSIPWDYVSHRVSLQTLMDRGFVDYLEWPIRRPVPPHLWDPPHWVPPAKVDGDFGRMLDQVLWSDEHGGCKMGDMLARFAKMFGARAPLRWIASQLFVECMSDDEDFEMDDSVAKVDDEDRSSPFGLSGRQLCSISEGVETCLSRWLEGSDFVQACTHFKELEGRVQDNVVGLELGFQKHWHIGDGPFTRTLSETDVTAFDTSYRQLLTEIEGLLKGIETEAVRIGL